MSYTQKYIQSFGKITKEELKIVKSTLNYEKCIYADAFDDLRQLIFSSLFKPKCNHIVGIERIEPLLYKKIYHKEHIARKGKWEGELNWKCPICNKRIWIWKTIRDYRLGRITIRKYVGGKR